MTSVPASMTPAETVFQTPPLGMFPPAVIALLGPEPEIDLGARHHCAARRAKATLLGLPAWASWATIGAARFHALRLVGLVDHTVETPDWPDLRGREMFLAQRGWPPNLTYDDIADRVILGNDRERVPAA